MRPSSTAHRTQIRGSKRHKQTTTSSTEQAPPSTAETPPPQQEQQEQPDPADTDLPRSAPSSSSAAPDPNVMGHTVWNLPVGGRGVWCNNAGPSEECSNCMSLCSAEFNKTYTARRHVVWVSRRTVRSCRLRHWGIDARHAQVGADWALQRIDSFEPVKASEQVGVPTRFLDPSENFRFVAKDVFKLGPLTNTMPKRRRWPRAGGWSMSSSGDADTYEWSWMCIVLSFILCKRLGWRVSNMERHGSCRWTRSRDAVADETCAVMTP